MDERVKALQLLLCEVDDWPLPVAVDYLIEHGWSVLDGWRPFVEGWRADLVHRLEVRTLQEIGVWPKWARVVSTEEGARLQVCWQRMAEWWSNDLDLHWSTTHHTLWARRDWGSYAGTDLVGLVRAWGADYPATYLCDYVALLWAAVRRFREGGASGA